MLSWLLYAIYATTNASLRNQHWRFASDLLWTLYGDFNCLDSSPHKLGSNPFQVNHSVLAFRNFISNCNPVNICLFGSHSNWCNYRFSHSRVLIRLDRVFATNNLLSCLGQTPSVLTLLPRRSLKFEPQWPEYPSVHNLLQLPTPTRFLSFTLAFSPSRLLFFSCLPPPA